MKFFPAIILLVPLNLYSQDADTTKIITDSLSFAESDTVASDTSQVTIKDSTIHVDTLYPLYQKPFYNRSFFINREIINKLDYRYTGDLFLPAGFSILKDKGAIGQLNEHILYGSGAGSINHLLDGILYNNRLTNNLDLNFIQNELIDSIEVVPLPRGFLYGPDNYVATVNFIEKDFLSPAPYTRIKYYEGPGGEAFFDGIFNTFFLKKLSFTLDITNRKFDSTYVNSGFSIWQAKAKIKYFLSNSINLIGSYSLVSSELGLNGGVSIDSISKLTGDINNLLYDPLQAPVVYPTLKQEVKLDKFSLKVLGSFGKYYSDLNLYYHTLHESYSGIPSKDEIKNYVVGGSLRQSYTRSFLRFELNSVFESRELNYHFVDTSSGFQRMKTKYNVFSISPVFSLCLLDGILNPSVFYKYTKYSEMLNAQTGFGVDLTLKPLNIVDFYFGISMFDFLPTLRADLYEAGVRIKYGGLFTDIRLFSRKNYRPNYGYTILYNISNSTISRQKNDLTGLALSLNYDFWKLRLEGRFNYNSIKETQTPVTSEIKMYFNGGIFYKDILLNRNLELKTGFVLKYYNFQSADYESAYQIDFTVAGIIQNAAIVYFSWENLLDKKYFIVPYYPMRERGIRFGLAWELLN
jgi:hypothetical protein